MAAHVDIHTTLSDIPQSTRAAFLLWHMENLEVWEAFERFALNAARSGKKIGAKAIAERVRWESEVEKNGEYKLNNDFVAYYARIWQAKYPEHPKFFEFREVHGLKRAA